MLEKEVRPWDVRKYDKLISLKLSKALITVEAA